METGTGYRTTPGQHEGKENTGTQGATMQPFGGVRLNPQQYYKRFNCMNPKKNNISEFPALKGYLPDNYDYHVCDYKTISETGDHLNFRATLRMLLSTEDEIKLWLKSHTGSPWRVERTCPKKGQKVLYKVTYRCQHKTRPRGFPGKQSKNTNCPAKMTVTLLHVRTQLSRGRQSLSTDRHMPIFPTNITIWNDHNHNIYVADAQRHRDVDGDETKQKNAKLFEAGDSPSSAGSDAERPLSSMEAGEDVEGAEASDVLAREELHSQWAEFSETVLNNEALQGGASAMMKTFNKLKGNPSMLLSALHMFGRYGNTSLASQRAQALRRVANRAGPSMAARLTSVARRKVKLGGQRRVTAGRPKNHTGDKQLKCNECGKCFNRKSYLNLHMRMHTGDKPYKCKECGKCFSQKSNRSTHMKIHTGDKPFKCIECGRCFGLKHDLKRHIIIHTGDKPFKCKECGICYSHQSNLNRHMFSHGTKTF